MNTVTSNAIKGPKWTISSCAQAYKLNFTTGLYKKKHTQRV